MELVSLELIRIKEQIKNEFSPCFIKIDRTRRALFVLKFASPDLERKFLLDDSFNSFLENDFLFVSLSYLGVNELILNFKILKKAFEPSLLSTAFRLFLPYKACTKEHEECITRAFHFLNEKKHEELALFMEHSHAEAKREGFLPPPLAMFAYEALKRQS